LQPLASKEWRDRIIPLQENSPAALEGRDLRKKLVKIRCAHPQILRIKRVK
jgi:hypothetical protein